VRTGITVFNTPDLPTANSWPFLPADMPDRPGKLRVSRTPKRPLPLSVWVLFQLPSPLAGLLPSHLLAFSSL
jgi:hypothetical protein